MNLTRAEARERADLITVDSYDIHLDLTKGGEVFGSTTTLKFTARPGSSTFIDAVTRTVHSATLNGQALDPAAVAAARAADLRTYRSHLLAWTLRDEPDWSRCRASAP